MPIEWNSCDTEDAIYIWKSLNSSVHIILENIVAVRLRVECEKVKLEKLNWINDISRWFSIIHSTLLPLILLSHEIIVSIDKLYIANMKMDKFANFVVINFLHIVLVTRL